MILFDYGHTLIGEPGFDSVRGTAAVMRRAVKNPRNLTPEQVQQFADELFFGVYRQARDLGLEPHNWQFSRLLYEFLRIEFDAPLAEIEQIFWDSAAPGIAMPYVDEALAYLRRRGIRTGVISNIGFSGSALTARLNRLLPEHSWEFVIASSEYLLRKPARMLFELALRKADLCAGDVWFCGDSPVADIAGAASAEIFPVWYENVTMENLWKEKGGVAPTVEHLHIHDWQELITALERLP